MRQNPAVPLRSLLDANAPLLPLRRPNRTLLLALAARAFCISFSACSSLFSVDAAGVSVVVDCTGRSNHGQRAHPRRRDARPCGVCGGVEGHTLFERRRRPWARILILVLFRVALALHRHGGGGAARHPVGRGRSPFPSFCSCARCVPGWCRRRAEPKPAVSPGRGEPDSCAGRLRTTPAVPSPAKDLRLAPAPLSVKSPSTCFVVVGGPCHPVPSAK